ncbi:MAG: hypothetical protein JNM97_22365 [Rhodoferax sp.]|nr:hypothetical protein [Rhodoferax sp.]
MAKPLKFTVKQLRQLRELGVVSEQVEALENILPLCRAMLRKLPPLGDVRSELLDLHKTLTRTSKALQRWERARNRELGERGDTVSTELDEAYLRVQMASYEISNDVQVLEKLLQAVHPALTCIDRAVVGLPTVSSTDKKLLQRRNEHPWAPIDRISQALTFGWGRAYYPIRHGDSTPADDAAPRTAPPFPHIASTGMNSAFRQIVGICYDAMHEKQDSDPERPIKAFLDWKRRRRQARGQGTAGT